MPEGVNSVELEVSFHAGPEHVPALVRICVLLPDGALLDMREKDLRTRICRGGGRVKSVYAGEAAARPVPAGSGPAAEGMDRWIEAVADSYRYAGWPGKKLDGPVVLAASAADGGGGSGRDTGTVIIDGITVRDRGCSSSAESSVACNFWKSAWDHAAEAGETMDYWELLRMVKDAHTGRFPGTAWDENDEITARLLLRDMIAGSPAPIFYGRAPRQAPFRRLTTVLPRTVRRNAVQSDHQKKRTEGNRDGALCPKG